MLSYLPGNDTEGGKDSLPLLREWVKEQVTLGIEVYEIPISLRELKLSSNEDWVICSSNDFAALVSTKSILGKSLRDLIDTLSGEGNQIVIIPKKSGKLGFGIAIDSSLKAWYSRQKESYSLWIANSAVRDKVEEAPMDLKSLIQPVSPELSVTDKHHAIRNSLPQETNGTAAPHKGGKKPA